MSARSVSASPATGGAIHPSQQCQRSRALSRGLRVSLGVTGGLLLPCVRLCLPGDDAEADVSSHGLAGLLKKSVARH